MKRQEVWLMPIVLNLMATAGLGWALLSEGWVSKAMATLLLATPITIAIYNATKIRSL